MDEFTALPRWARFDDPAGVAAALRDASIDYISHAPGRFAATLVSAQFGPLRLQLMSDGPHISRGAIAPDRTALLFKLGHSDGDPMVNGLGMMGEDVMLLGPDAAVEARVPSAVDWVGLSFAPGDLASQVGAESLPANGHFSLRRMTAALRDRVNGRIRELGSLAATDPWRLLQDSVQAGIAEDLLHLIGGITASDAVEPISLRALHRRVALVRRADDFMTAHLADALYSDDVQRALGVPMRTLHEAFVAVHGMSMHRFLRIRRLNLARQALRRDTVPQANLVKAAALDHGFWHLGRFAREYHALFGELPSATRRSA